MATLYNVFLYGIFLGGVYAVVAFGLGLIYGVMRVINLAHGTVLMLAAYAAFTLQVHAGLDPLLSLPLVLPASYLAGAALYSGILRRVANGPPMAAMLLLFGLALLGRNLAYIIWTGDDQSVTLTYGLSTVWLGTPVPVTKLVVFGLSLVVTLGLSLGLRRTHLGRSVRAVAEDPLAAELTGLSVERINRRAFGLGTAIAALGGVMLSTLYVINPELGRGFLLKSFCIIVLGGMDSMAGIFIGALLLGVAETATGVYASAAMQDAVSFILLVLILVLLPGGLPSWIPSRVGNRRFQSNLTAGQE